MSAPGPDDPRYWERLRDGPPLDEWESIDSRAFARREEAAGRRAARWERAWWWIVAAIVAALFGFGIATADDDAHDEGVAVCWDERGEYPC